MTRETVTYPALDEAIAAALLDSAPGDLVTIHGERCAGREDAVGVMRGCTCEPLELRTGARA